MFSIIYNNISSGVSPGQARRPVVASFYLLREQRYFVPGSMIDLLAVF